MVRLKNMLLFFFTSLLPAVLPAQRFAGNPGNIHWKQINTKNSRVIFPAGLDSQANRISNMAALLDSSTVNTIGGEHRKWNIVLLNQTTVPNAYVRLAPVMSELYMTPDQNNFSQGSIRWDDNLIIHEDRHMQQLSNFNHGLTKIFSFFLGQEGQLLANGLVIPDYFFEADAVWQETFVSMQGRGRLPNFYNGFKSLWLSNKKYSWMKLRSGSYHDYTPGHYELGYLLIAYGNATYGEDFWKKVTQDAVRFKGLFYPFNRAIERYSGKTYQQFRKDALDFFERQSFANPGKTETYDFITDLNNNLVTDYLFPKYIGKDSILVTRSSYRSLNAFYLIIKGKEKKIRIKNTVLDDNYAYSNGKIVYASFQSDPRWSNRDYSVLQVVDIHTRQQKQITTRSRYFSPDINADATEVLAVQVNPDGTNYLHRLNINTGALLLQVPNPNNYFFTQTKYINSNEAVSAVRNVRGEMALVKINLSTGITEAITGFTYNIIGYPFIKGDTIYFNCMNGNADKIFAVTMKDKKIYRITDNKNGVYYPDINANNEMLVAVFTVNGLRLARININGSQVQEIGHEEFTNVEDLYTAKALHGKGANMPDEVMDEKTAVTKYRKSFRLFNFHSRRPYVADPEYGYSFYSDNVLSSFSNVLNYTYNRNENSHTVGFFAAYGGWFPILSVGLEGSFNRTFDTAIGKSITFNSAKLNAGFSVPLNFIGGRTNKYFNIGVGYNMEELYYHGIGKNIFKNQSFNYINAFLSISNIGRQARQHVNPHWGQRITADYRYALSFRDNRKFVANSSFYFPGFFPNHSIVLQGSFQKRDTLPDLFSNTFSYSRGYTAFTTRRMYKFGVNYQLPLFYPDFGVANIIFLQRVRANAFYDYTDAFARLNGILTNILSRSTGAEVFFDTKLWNSLPFSFGVRYSKLIDTDLRNPGVDNRWDIVLFNFIPE